MQSVIIERIKRCSIAYIHHLLTSSSTHPFGLVRLLLMLRVIDVSHHQQTEPTINA
jgi:hypothetical protein